MSDYLYKIFHESEKDLVDDVIHQLRHSTSPHYMEIESNILQERVESLVAFFLLSLKKKPDPFVKYVAEMASERIAEGFSINECLMALRILEERSWLLVAQFVPQQGLMKALSRVTGNVGAAKDQLAHVYVAHLEETSLSVNAN